MTASKSKRKDIRAAIRDAGLREFARNGLMGTSTQRLAEAAGISKPKLHYYISSKEELYDEILDYVIDQWRTLHFISCPSEEPQTAISDYIERKLLHALEHPEVTRFFSREISGGALFMDSRWSELKEAVERACEVMQTWIDNGQIAPVDPLLFHFNIWAVTQHYADYEPQIRTLLGTPPDAPLDRDRILAEVKNLFQIHCAPKT